MHRSVPWLVAMALLATAAGATWLAAREHRAGATITRDAGPSVPAAPAAELRSEPAREGRAVAADARRARTGEKRSRDGLGIAPAGHDLLLIDDPTLRERLVGVDVVRLEVRAPSPDDADDPPGTRHVERAALAEIEGGFAFERAAAPGVAHAYRLEPLGLALVAVAPRDAPLLLRVPHLVEAWIDVVDRRGNAVALDTVAAAQVIVAGDGAALDVLTSEAWPRGAPATVEVPLRVPIVPGAWLRLVASASSDSFELRTETFDCGASLHHTWVLDGRRWLEIELARGVVASDFAWDRLTVELEGGALEPVAASMTESIGPPQVSPDGRDAANAPPDEVLIADHGVVALVLPRVDGEEPLRVEVPEGATRVVVRRAR